MCTWRFPSNDFGEIKGINDTGVSLFRGTPLKSLAREICQNSLDATTDETTIIEFNMFSIPTIELPGFEVLKDAFERCIEFWSIQKAKTTREYFEKSLEVINREYCEILRISDFNTTGLLGSKEELNTDWTNLTKSSGASDKRGTAGGSFGIGKFAPFACSDLSTVFYSTYDIEEVEAYQGVSRLVTFRDPKNNKTTQGVGYYGMEKNMPVFEQLNFEKEYRRENSMYGTDIYIAGFRHGDRDWEKEIILSILDGFLGAIWNNKLVVRIGEKEISKDSLNDLIEIYRDEPMGYADKYYEVLISENTSWVEEEFHGLGNVKLGILRGDQDTPKRIAMIRKTGMKIMDRSSSSGHVPIIGVMFIEGDKINERLRSIENPEHTKWEPERSHKPRRETQLIKDIIGFIRREVDKLIYSSDQVEMDAVGVGSYIPIDIDEDKGSEAQEEIFDERIQVIETKLKQARTIAGRKTGSLIYNIDESEEEESQEIAGDDQEWYPADITTHNRGNEAGNESNLVDGNRKQARLKNVERYSFIPICVDRNRGVYVFLLRLDEDVEDGILEVFLSAETQRYNAPIKEASLINGQRIKVTGNKIEGLNFKQDEDMRIRVRMEYYDYCSLEVIVYDMEK